MIATLLLCVAQDWPQWRGPHWDGSSAVEGLPAVLGEEHVRFALELPGNGAGTPIVVGERVLVTSAVEDAGALVVACFKRTDGELLWELEAARGATRRDERSDFASPSPVSDGTHAWFLFGNGTLVCAELASGKEVWKRELQRELGTWAYQWTYGASPTLWGGKLYLPVLQRDQPTDGSKAEKKIPSYLLALDAASGKTLFQIERAAPAKMESLESYATVLPVEGGARRELLVVGGDVLTGHDPESGKELWRWGTWNEGHREPWWRLVPTPVVGAGRVLVCAPKRAPVYCLELGGSGTLDDKALRWKSSGRPNRVSSDVPTPLFFAGDFFVLSDVERALSRVDPENGQPTWTVELPERGPWEASPTGADGRVWCLSHEGLLVGVETEGGALTTKLELGREGEGPARASVAAAHGRLYVRTSTRLLALGAP
jgi:outer membrane protein assembly factor BamB